MDDKLIAAARRTIKKGQQYRCLIPSLPQIMTVEAITETEVHFTRKGQPGIKIMGILRFCEIAVPIEGEGE